MTYKKVLGFILVLLLVISLVGCGFSMAVLPLTLETGDSFSVKMESDDTYYELEFDESDNILYFYEHDEDKDNGYKAIFLDEDGMTGYLGNILEFLAGGMLEMKHVDDGAINGVKYTMISFVNQGEKTYEIIGWIEGSNTGLLFDGTTSKSKTLDAFSCLTFEIKETDQEDEDYYYENIDDLEDIWDYNG